MASMQWASRRETRDSYLLPIHVSYAFSVSFSSALM